jgi:hypothetical protein
VADDEEDWDRRFIELLQELRVMQTGIQILFAFLLTLPFSNRFGDLTHGQTVIYVLTLAAAAVATAFLIAPVSFHRLTRTAVNKLRIVRVAARLAQVGLLLLLLAVGGAVYLVTDFVLNTSWARLICGVLAAVYVGLWYVLPLGERLSRAGRMR